MAGKEEEEEDACVHIAEARAKFVEWTIWPTFRVGSFLELLLVCCVPFTTKKTNESVQWINATVVRSGGQKASARWSCHGHPSRGQSLAFSKNSHTALMYICCSSVVI